MERLDSYCRELREQCCATDLPVDVFLIAESLGIQVRRRRWRGRPHSVCVPDCCLVILNRARPQHSQRFDLAHEIGEFFIPDGAIHDKLPNQFAACLLMPAMEFTVELGIAQSVNGTLTALFGVSETAARIRARELNLSPPPTFMKEEPAAHPYEVRARRPYKKATPPTPPHLSSSKWGEAE